jgi:uncharacterized membrane protein YgdD (TMEM256/DUF423 family)
MPTRQFWDAVGLLALLTLMAALPLEAATRAIPGITNAAAQVADTIKTIGYLVAPVLIICAVYEARQHAGFGVMFSIVGVILVVGIILFSDEIVAFIKPGAAAAGTLIPIPTLAGWWDLGQQLVSVSGLAEGIRRVRRT